MATLNKHYKLWELCLTEKESPKNGANITRYIHFMDGYAHAFNMCAAVRAKLKDIAIIDESEIELLNGKSILAEDFKELPEKEPLYITGDCIYYFKWLPDLKMYSKTKTVINLVDTRDTEDAVHTFSKIERIFYRVACMGEEYEPITTIGFNLKTLNKIDKAIDGKGDLLFGFYKKEGIVTIKKAHDGLGKNITAVLIPSVEAACKE